MGVYLRGPHLGPIRSGVRLSGKKNSSGCLTLFVGVLVIGFSIKFWFITLPVIFVVLSVLFVNAYQVKNKRKQLAEQEALEREQEALERQETLERYRREAEDTLSRTYRTMVSEYHIDPLLGGSFTLRTENGYSMTYHLAGDAALLFLSLKKGDIINVTLNSDRTNLQEFSQLYRASGAKPRSAVYLNTMEKRGIEMPWMPAPPPETESIG